LRRRGVLSGIIGREEVRDYVGSSGCLLLHLSLNSSEGLQIYRSLYKVRLLTYHGTLYFALSCSTERIEKYLYFKF